MFELMLLYEHPVGPGMSCGAFYHRHAVDSIAAGSSVIVLN